MRGRLIDGIIWFVVGVSLLAQAGFLVVLGWASEGTVAPDLLPAGVAGGVVALGFVGAGLGALVLGMRSVSAARSASATHRRR